jgi:hypothetical protein
MRMRGGCVVSPDGILERDLQSHCLHRQESFSISSRVVDRIVCVLGLPQVLEILEHVLDHPLV